MCTLTLTSLLVNMLHYIHTVVENNYQKLRGAYDATNNFYSCIELNYSSVLLREPHTVYALRIHRRTRGENRCDRFELRIVTADGRHNELCNGGGGFPPAVFVAQFNFVKVGNIIRIFKILYLLSTILRLLILFESVRDF